MKNLMQLLLAVVIPLMMIPATASNAGDNLRAQQYPRDQLDRQLDQLDRVREQMTIEADAEQLRDKRHDGRLKTGAESSVGASAEPPGLDLRTTY